LRRQDRSPKWLKPHITRKGERQSTSEARTSRSIFVQIHVWLENPAGDIPTMIAEGSNETPLTQDGTGYDGGDILHPNADQLPTWMLGWQLKGILLQVYSRE